MAKITFKGQSEYYKKLQQLQDVYRQDEPLERVVYKGASVVADAIRARIEGIPVTGFQRLPKGKKFWSHTDSKFIDPNTAGLGRDKMAKLMYGDQDAKNKDCC